MPPPSAWRPSGGAMERGPDPGAAQRRPAGAADSTPSGCAGSPTACGIKAKNDKLDAGVIARFVATLPTRPLSIDPLVEASPSTSALATSSATN